MPPPPAEEIFDNPADWVAKHIRRYVETDGEKGHRAYGHDSLLLTTRGRRSGKLRRTALWYLRDGDRYLLVGSNGGSRWDPAWVHNVRANRAVVVQVRGDSFAALARTATAEERPALWERIATEIPQYAGYQKRIRRELPIVIVESASSS
jgi:deazaflavin-dependent oxidoreductase (nitroreductase family)